LDDRPGAHNQGGRKKELLSQDVLLGNSRGKSKRGKRKYPTDEKEKWAREESREPLAKKGDASTERGKVKLAGREDRHEAM